MVAAAERELISSLQNESVRQTTPGTIHQQLAHSPNKENRRLLQQKFEQNSEA